MEETAPAFEPETYVAATAALLGVTLDDAWTTSIAANLRVLAAAAALLTDFPLPDQLEAAPRFEA